MELILNLPNGVIITGVTIINMLDDSGISIDASNAVSLNEFKIDNVSR